MSHKTAIWISLILINYSFHCTCQIIITMPVERSVFQRVNNKGNIQIGGQIASPVSKIEARLTVLNGGTFINWTTIHGNAESGTFRAQLIDIVAGWYKLEIRAMLNNQQIGDIVEISKVGVGEVFVIAGQSNAQGGRPPDGGFYSNVFYGAIDDRVNCVDNYFSETTDIYPIPNISKIAPETNVSPKGKASWCWALLGDRIAEEWNVPVLFFNAAVGATNCAQWKNSAYGEAVYDQYSPTPNEPITNGWPYIHLKKSLEYYTKIFGIRAIIWHQGENDMAFFDAEPQTFGNYINNLKSVIQKTRQHSGKDISWVIARVSRVGNGLNYNLKLAQKTVAEEANLNTFLGPDTDLIQPGNDYRDGGVHFKNEGFIDLADVWFDWLNNYNFINNSNPIPATNNLQVVDNQFVFGNSTAPCSGINQTITSGDWHNASTWSCGSVPNSLNEITINEGHTVIINNKTVYVKNLILNGSISLENDGNIVVVE